MTFLIHRSGETYRAGELFDENHGENQAFVHALRKAHLIEPVKLNTMKEGAADGGSGDAEG